MPQITYSQSVQHGSVTQLRTNHLHFLTEISTFGKEFCREGRWFTAIASRWGDQSDSLLGKKELTILIDETFVNGDQSRSFFEQFFGMIHIMGAGI